MTLQDCGMLLPLNALRSLPMMILSVIFCALLRQELTPKWWSQDYGKKQSCPETIFEPSVSALQWQDRSQWYRGEMRFCLSRPQRFPTGAKCPALPGWISGLNAIEQLELEAPGLAFMERMQSHFILRMELAPTLALMKPSITGIQKVASCRRNNLRQRLQ
ncbi:hypothetical protein HOY80DRAFT_1080309 [Tuber brumale]|nr:hypothetical protein HOY80DRAFT_1080309 [Tuber brumale]